MAEASRTEAREVTEKHTAESLDYLKPGDTVVEAGMFQIQVDRTETIPGKVTLELTEDEARFLADVLASVGGDYRHSRRKFQSAITDALGDVGIPHDGKRSRDMHGSIMFRQV